MTVADSSVLERVELKGRTPVSRTTIHGWPSIIFGFPFAGAGGFILMIAIEWVRVPPSSVHAPLWVIGVFGTMFLLAGLSFIWHGGQGLRRRAQIADAKRGRVASPWLWDYEWQALGISDNKFNKVIHALVMIAVFSAFLAPFHWWAFVSDDGDMFVKVFVIVFDLICGFGCGYYLISNSALYLKYGNSRLKFSSFPFYLGEEIAVVLDGLPAPIKQMQVDLRFIEEKYETRRRGRKRESVVVCYQLFHESRIFKGNAVSPSGTFALRMPLPDEPEFTTTLSQRPARFWELEVKADTPGVDYHSRFLLPVYEKAGSHP